MIGSEVTATCNDCGHSASLASLAVHSCSVQRSIEESGTGRCEDYPCCGHTDGDGCQTLPSHTAAYWSDLQQSMGDDRYEDYLDALDRQEAGY